MKIAVVGAGSAGMAMAKQILDVQRKLERSDIEFTLFERRAEVGGIWQYDQHVEPGYLAYEAEDGTLHEKNSAAEGHGQRVRMAWKGSRQPGPMFDGLRTNIPCDLMSYRDELFAEDTDLFPSRSDVQAYLQAYATRHDLRRFVRFDTTVERIVKDGSSSGDSDGGWIVESRTGDGKTKEHYTHVVLAHGRCNTPNIPDNITGLDTFAGALLHSAWYRDPRDFLGKTVVVVGNGSSGMDIARELSGFATRPLPCGLSPDEWKAACQASGTRVFSSWRSRDKPPAVDYNPLDAASPAWCRRINVVEAIAHVDGHTVHFADGTTLSHVDVIIFATGFLFDCPFLDQSVGPLRQFPVLPPCQNARRSGRASPTMFNMDDWLLMHAHDETLAMLQLPVRIVPFPLTEVQSFYLVNRWLGKADELPKLDGTIDVSDESRWTSSRPQEAASIRESGQPDARSDTTLQPMSHVFGRASEWAYVDRLLSFVRSDLYPSAGQPVPWQDEYESDGRGKGLPRGPEARYAVSPWRLERRNNGRELRRETLGY